MSNVFALITGRWARILILLVWLVVGMAMGSLQPKLQEKTKNDPVTYLPGSAEATKTLNLQRDRFASGMVTPAVVIVHAKDGKRLTQLDLAAVEGMFSRFAAKVGTGDFKKALPPVTPASSEGTAGGFLSDDHKAVYGILPLTGDDANKDIIPAVKQARKIAKDSLPSDLQAHVTGAAGISADAVEVFSSIDGPVLGATLILVLVLLIATYRSPVIWFFPLLSVALAYMVAAGIVYLLVDAGKITLNGQTTSILIVLMFGAGTDYSLLVVSRLREELRRHTDAKVAAWNASRATFGAILSSGSTVVAAMLLLSIATLDSTATMGPVLALGIAISMLSAFTLLPALLSIGGRWAFWPRIPRYGDEETAGSGRWAGVGRFVQKSPIRAIVLGVAILVLFGAGNMVKSESLGFGDTDAFSKRLDSTDGFDLLKQHYAAGFLAQSDVVVESKDKANLFAAAGDVAAALRADDRIAAVDWDASRADVSRDGQLVIMHFAFRKDPYSPASEDAIPSLRKIAKAAAHDVHASAWIGGPTAQVTDTDAAVKHDEKRIIPGVLLLIFVILTLLLRAVVAPLHLVVSVVASFLATLGFSTWLFIKVLDHPGIDQGYPTFLFIFVVALGVDYNIFLVHRIREETRERGTVEGTVHALGHTGAVITSAGLVLAGTFMILGTLPVYTVKQIGIGVAIGVLFDTFVVRSFLVPAMMMLLGDRNWWPGRPPGPASLTGVDLHEGATPEHEPTAAR